MKPFFLIADDSSAKRLMLIGMVHHSRWDVEILVAETTEEAEEHIAVHPEIAAAFIDYEMPSAQGPAVIRALRVANPEARIALVTASDSQAYKANAEEAGADAFVCTSWPLDQVGKAIADLLLTWRTEATA